MEWPSSTGGSGRSAQSADDGRWRSRVIERPATDAAAAPWPRQVRRQHGPARAPRTGARKALEGPAAAEGAVHHHDRRHRSRSSLRSPTSQHRRRERLRGAGIRRPALLVAAKARERRGDRLVGCPLERHDQVRASRPGSPSARRRTRARWWAARSNSASSPSKRKANHTCFWPLPAAAGLASRRSSAGSRRRSSRRCGPGRVTRARAGLLGQLAPRGGLQVLAGVDAALRELPVVRARRAGAPAQPDPAVRVEQHDADVGPVVGEVGHHRLAVRAEAGAS